MDDRVQGDQETESGESVEEIEDLETSDSDEVVGGAPDVFYFGN